MIISFLNQKGGVGKTTLSVHFAAWLKATGKHVNFYDADTQASSSLWLASLDPSIEVDKIDPNNPDIIPEQVIKLAAKADYTICDGQGGLGEGTRTLLVLSDYAFFPITPSYLDAHSLQRARSQLHYANTLNPARPPTARVILNKVKLRSRIAQDTRAAEKNIGIEMLQNSVRDLDAFRIACQEMLVVWKLPAHTGVEAAKDMKALFSEILQLMSTKQTKEEVRRAANA